MMRREMRVTLGRIEHNLGGGEVPVGKWLLHGDEFLVRLEHLSMHYRKGAGVTVERRPGARASEEALFLNGSVYAAAACINGLYPIHASAVAHDGVVHAFTGPSGAGKSTLIAALGARGLPMFCDDTLILDLSDPAVPMALPGHKRLKLTASAVALTGATAQEAVDTQVDKVYARSSAGDCAHPLPLRSLAFLEEGETPRLAAIEGAEKIARLGDDHYTHDLHERAAGLDAAARFALRARLARQLVMARLIRPRDLTCFAESVDLALTHVCGQASPT